MVQHKSPISTSPTCALCLQGLAAFSSLSSLPTVPTQSTKSSLPPRPSLLSPSLYSFLSFARLSRFLGHVHCTMTLTQEMEVRCFLATEADVLTGPRQKLTNS